VHVKQSFCNSSSPEVGVILWEHRARNICFRGVYLFSFQLSKFLWTTASENPLLRPSGWNRQYVSWAVDDWEIKPMMPSKGIASDNPRVNSSSHYASVQPHPQEFSFLSPVADPHRKRLDTSFTSDSPHVCVPTLFDKRLHIVCWGHLKPISHSLNLISSF
jgi:hypothetical protein